MGHGDWGTAIGPMLIAWHHARDARRPGEPIGNTCCAITACHHGREPGIQAAAGLHPSAFNTRFVDAGARPSRPLGRIGRATRLPPQLGQTPLSTVSVQAAQNVHSKEQIRASGLSGGRSRSQHSQFGRSSSICILPVRED